MTWFCLKQGKYQAYHSSSAIKDKKDNPDCHLFMKTTEDRLAEKLEEKIDFIQVECQRKLWQVLRELKTAVKQHAAQKIPRHHVLMAR